MGVDVNLYAEGVVTDDELAAAEAYMAERVSTLGWSDSGEPTLLRRSDPEDMYDPPRIELSTGQRFWGPGYERGNWPLISAGILCLRVALPNCTVFYGGDTTDYGIEATDELLSEFWLHFLGPEGDAYHARWRRAGEERA